MGFFLLEQYPVWEVEQFLVFPVFLVRRHLAFQQRLQVSTRAAVQGVQISSHKVPADKEGFRESYLKKKKVLFLFLVNAASPVGGAVKTIVIFLVKAEETRPQSRISSKSEQ